MRDDRIVLSARLQMLADMVTPGNRLADVGCDHGFLSIYLVQAGLCPGALAMDVRKGPLAAAKKHVEEYGLEKYIETRLSDGLTACEAGEADTLVCAGMGGRLMEKILTDSMDKVRQLRELILQPQSELREFRAFLRGAGFQVTAEDAVFEEGRYYFAMKAVRGGAVEEQKSIEVPVESHMVRRIQGEAAGQSRGEAKETESVRRIRGEAAGQSRGEAKESESVQRLYDLYGRGLLMQKHPVLQEYLQQRERYIKKLEASLTAADSMKAKERLAKVRRELSDIENALAYF